VTPAVGGGALSETRIRGCLELERSGRGEEGGTEGEAAAGALPLHQATD
jgi:hypothetical protein